MKILAIDTTALVASVAICEDEVLLGEVTLNNGNTHSETLLPTVEFLLSRLSLERNDVDLFAIAEGPGSFTGVRIGAATVKGLAFGTEKPCVGVSTLEALAYNLRSHDGLICPVMNARRKQVYTALFKAENSQLKRLMPDSAIAIEELDLRLRETSLPIRLVGDGYDITSSLLSHETIFVPHNLRNQSAYSVAQVARITLALSPEKSFSDLELAPTYLRLSQAERERNERLQRDTGI